MKRPLISIIIPVYNSEKYLNECICSCIEQTYDNIEIVLVDDGSLDNSLEICKSYGMKDSRVKTIHQPNAGVSAARNTGLRNAKGDYIFFLDSDDEIYSNSIELLLKDMIKYEADIVSGVYSTVDNLGNEKCRYNDGRIIIYEGEEPIILSLKYDRQTNSACAKLFSRKIIENVFFTLLTFLTV